MKAWTSGLVLGLLASIWTCSWLLSEQILSFTGPYGYASLCTTAIAVLASGFFAGELFERLFS